jgi:flagellar hook protein FlgE
MLRSMFAAVSGLRAHQSYMDVVGNNIANVNTTGYKSSGAIFQDLLSQTINGAGAPIDMTKGGTNPAQVGLGVRLSSIQTNFAQGASQLTGRATDFAIQGDGLFVINQGGVQGFTRAGSFSLDGLGQLVDPDGGFVQGWQADTKGNLNTNAAIGNIKIPVGQTIAPVTTQNIKIGGNLPSDMATGQIIDVSQNVYNSLGTSVPIRVEFTKVADTAGSVNWTVQAYDSANNPLLGAGATPPNPQAVPLTFDLNGNRTSPDTVISQADLDKIAGTAGTWAAAGITLNMGATTAVDRLTGSATLNSVGAVSQDGSGVGSLVSFSMSDDGMITGVFSNGRNQPLGQVALAVFANPAGLSKAGGSLYVASNNSGQPQIGVAGTGGRGTLSGGTLEMSNVDLAQEFTNLIVAQRGYEANAKVITASDEILQDLVNLKR